MNCEYSIQYYLLVFTKYSALFGILGNIQNWNENQIKI